MVAIWHNNILCRVQPWRQYYEPATLFERAWLAASNLRSAQKLATETVSNHSIRIAVRPYAFTSSARIAAA